MAMNKREAAEIILVGRNAARRMNATFEVDRDMLSRFGFSTREMEAIEQTVSFVEASRETFLSRLDRT